MKKKHATAGSIEQLAIGLLLECHAIRECPDHGHMRDNTDPGAVRKACEIAKTYPFRGATPDESIAAIDEALKWIGDTCPGCS